MNIKVKNANIALVTVLYKSSSVLNDFFKSLSGLSDAYFLYVIDNNETDIDVKTLKATASLYNISYRYFSFGENRGVAKGNNVGVSEALRDGCQWIGLINNDIHFTDAGLLKNLIDEATRLGASAVVPKITYFGTRKIWYGGGRFSQYTAVTTHLQKLRNDGIQSSQVTFTEYAPTCFMLIKKTAFESLGLFDERYFVYYDDADWVYRYRKSQNKLLYCGKCEIAHKVSVSTGGEDSEFSIFYSTRNRIYFARKSYSMFSWVVFVLYFCALRAPLRWLTLSTKLRASYQRAIIAGFRMKPQSTGARSW